MKHYLVILFFLAATSFSPPKKIYRPYAITIAKSVLIVDGTISNVGAEAYEFEISEVIKGTSQDQINVSIWKEWSCDGRAGKIKKGQRLVLFLSKEEGNFYVPFNGSTGELFVSIDDSVKTFSTISFPKVEELKNGIEMFQKAFKFNGDLNKRFEKDKYFERLISQEEIIQLKEQNEFFKFIVDEELDRYEIK